MKTATGTLIGQRSFRLAYASWLPEQEPVALAVVVHGYGEHMGRYRHVIEVLVERGFGVYAIDHRGHGGSQGLRASVERFDYFVDDLHLLVQQAKAAHPDLHLVMIGHSMGGLIATRYALRHQRELHALVLSGAALLIGESTPGYLKKLSRVLAAVVPTLGVVPAAKDGAAVLSRDEAVQRAFASDTLCYTGKLRARMGYEMWRAAIDTQARMEQITLPLLIMHGADDTLTDPRGSTMLYEKAGSADKTLKLWPGCRHEIFNEPEQAEILAYMVDWIAAHVPQPDSRPLAMLA